MPCFVPPPPAVRSTALDTGIGIIFPPRDESSSRPVAVTDFSDLAARLSPSVVRVLATVVRNQDDTPRRLTGIGSGMIVGDGSRVLTNHHVIAGATSLKITFGNHREIAARVVADDALIDLALLELDTPAEGIRPITLAHRQSRPGQPIMAIGQPYGLGNTVTVGVISGLGRNHTDLGRPPALDPLGLWSFIQTDAPINIGNSGGPLVNTEGHVVGVTTAVRLDAQGLAFAIPAEMAQVFLNEVAEFGRLRRVKLGVRAENVGSDIVPRRSATVRVTHVDTDGPAHEAGLMPNDLIHAIDGQTLGRVSELAYLAQLRGVGQLLELSVSRTGGDDLKTILLRTAEASRR
ncbi:MAG: trypsin-like peptidase domain-containing protein [Nannocystaceae bacterium]